MRSSDPGVPQGPTSRLEKLERRAILFFFGLWAVSIAGLYVVTYHTEPGNGSLAWKVIGWPAFPSLLLGIVTSWIRIAHKAWLARVAPLRLVGLAVAAAMGGILVGILGLVATMAAGAIS